MVLVVFWEEIVRILGAVVRLDFESGEGRLALFIALGSIPTALIGYFFHDILESFFYNVLVVGVALLINGLFLFLSERREEGRELGILDSLLIGTAQGVAIIPGISRSGLTIATGLLRGVDKEAAFRYSFLLSVPAVMGAAISEFARLSISSGVSINSPDLAIILSGIAVSMIIGYLSLKLLRKIVMQRKFHLFAYYCWTVGIIIIVNHPSV